MHTHPCMHTHAVSSMSATHLMGCVHDLPWIPPSSPLSPSNRHGRLSTGAGKRCREENPVRPPCLPERFASDSHSPVEEKERLRAIDGMRPNTHPMRPAGSAEVRALRKHGCLDSAVTASASAMFAYIDSPAPQGPRIGTLAVPCPGQRYRYGQ